VTDDIRTVVVDDDVPTRIGVRTILSSEPGIEVVGEAPNASLAMALVRDVEPDVVLMDVQLPDLDGIEATRRIIASARDEAKVPRVIVLTTFDFDEYVYRSLRAGASGFLLKRTRAEDLVEAVRVVADGNSLPVPQRLRDLIEHFTAPSDNRIGVDARLPLTGREAEVLILIASGFSNQEIADRLVLSLDTVKTHVKHVYVKCHVRDRAQAVIAAYESGLMIRSDEAIL
jgi:DNA-binding NarL/FixJ family response regulator